jgi:molybdopterin-guanine dinucleotide biosynthesis protein A
MMARTAGIILAGGRSTRMGGAEKAFLAIDGKPLVARAIERLRPQVERLAINANGDPARFAAFGLPVVADTVPGFAGPLAGILAGMRWAAERECQAVATVAVDTPFLPVDLAARLEAAREGETDRPVVAESGGRLHPVFGLWPVALADELAAFLDAGETFKVAAFAQRCGAITAVFPTDPSDAFFNINRPEDLAAAEARAAGERP